jgi:EAL domain-containing protein (putative c-di-GMP-specific phosphodiesterase class I)
MNGNEFETVKVAIGIASFSTGGMIEDAIDNANIAYREVKYSKTESVALFNNHIQTKRFHSIMIEKSLRHSVTNNLIIPFFQPKVNANGVLSGYESLARLYDNDGRLIMPGDFIAVAEDTGLIVNLGDWMLEESYRQLNETRLLLGHPEKLSLAFNVSANQLFGNSILNTFQRTCVNNDRFSLELEITENVFVDWSSNISKLLDKFRCDGALIVLDDFGTGYSSLSYISKYSVDIVKLDRNFIIGIEHDLAQRKLVEAIIKLAHSLSILVVAEGIETEEQRRLVVDMGVDEMQGYLFGRPMPIELLELPGVRKE